MTSTPRWRGRAALRAARNEAILLPAASRRPNRYGIASEAVTGRGDFIATPRDVERAALSAERIPHRRAHAGPSWLAFGREVLGCAEAVARCSCTP